jgi:hypothetical protein
MKFRITGCILAAALFVGVSAAVAASTVVVTPTNTHGWSTEDTRPGGTVSFVVDPTAPAGNGALRLQTDASVTAKAQFMHETNTPLADVTELSYWTKQNSGPPEAAPSYQLPINLTGTGGFTTLVYEPYWNGVVLPGTWQQWDVDGGLFWSSRTVVCSHGTIVGAPGGPPTYTLAQIETICPEAVVVGYGVNVGTFNPLYDVETDLFDFDGTTYDFEPYQSAQSGSDCKNGGYANVTRADGSSFKNQGDCVSYTNNGK